MRAAPKYPSRKEFIQYLNDYVSRFSISPRYRRLVEAASYNEVSGKWRIKARDLESGEAEEYTSRFLVVATGETCDPKIPKVEGLESFRGEICTRLSTKTVKNSKGEGFWWLGVGILGWKLRLILQTLAPKPPLLCEAQPEEGPFTVKLKYGKFPVIDVGTFNKIKSGEIEGEDVDSLLNDDGFAKSFPNHWKGKKGMYCAGLAQKGFYRTLPVTSRPYSDSENILFTIHVCVQN
ncbi:putative indole-3-pyruvate monooxygenase YUCCA10 [Sesamum angolense]|uniref:Indole-3-pyruvate monooxygenase YUCCA10 n=1 Tax=Sesamum angolense TaxID=2727404 RepID=A0AAE1X829_9LAMI|nr:putative indole-3-pyruvate monooxygenase YUCCA10 [Sesamum angolense]